MFSWAGRTAKTMDFAVAGTSTGDPPDIHVVPLVEG